VNPSRSLALMTAWGLAPLTLTGTPPASHAPTGTVTGTMEVRGVAAHAGNDPRTGRSAILEIAHKIIEIQSLTDWDEGTTFSVGTIKGGSTSNTIPECAAMEIDMRCVSISLAAERMARLQAIAATSHIEGTRTTLSGRMVFQPMETTPEIMRLFERVARTSVENGFNRPVPTQSGGGSDSSNAVIAGVPTICSMGVKGGRNHSPDEYAMVESLFERCKLVVTVILDLDCGKCRVNRMGSYPDGGTNP